MLAPKIAVETAPFGRQLKQSIQNASRLEVGGIHVDLRNEVKASDLSETGRRQFLHMLQELSLSIASATFPTRRAFSDPNEIDGRVAATCNAMKFAAELKCRVMTLRVGKIPNDPDSKEYQLLFETMQDVARFGNHIGVVLCLSLTGESPETVKAFINSIQTGPVGCNFDPAVCIMSGQNPSAMLRDFHPHVHHITVRDAVRDIDGGGREVPVGRGETDWEELLAIVSEMDYTGWLAVSRTSGDDKPGDISRAVQYLRNVMQVF